MDIAFRLERTFDIKIPRGGIEQAAQEAHDDGDPYEIDGVLTERGRTSLADAMPQAAESNDGNFAGSAIAGPMQRFLSSDVIYDDSSNEPTWMVVKPG